MTPSCILRKSISLYQHRVRSTELLMSPLDNREYDLTFGIGDINSPLSWRQP
jgi:hypothetical protein